MLLPYNDVDGDFVGFNGIQVIVVILAGARPRRSRRYSTSKTLTRRFSVRWSTHWGAANPVWV
jgi:hypothetical protein